MKRYELDHTTTEAVLVCPWCMREYPIDTFTNDEIPLCSLCGTAILERRIKTRIRQVQDGENNQ